jgi:hypothetical protein
MEMSAEMVVLRNWMIASVVLYLGGGFNFVAGQNRLLQWMNAFSTRFFKDRLPLIPLSTEKFWLVLTTSMMLMLVVCCGLAAYDAPKFYWLVMPVLFSKACSTIFYLLLFFFQKRYFAYLVGAFTDGPLLIITLIIFLRALPAAA